MQRAVSEVLNSNMSYKLPNIILRGLHVGIVCSVQFHLRAMLFDCVSWVKMFRSCDNPITGSEMELNILSLLDLTLYAENRQLLYAN